MGEIDRTKSAKVVTVVEGQVVIHTFPNHSSRFVHLLVSKCGYCDKKKK